MSRPIKPAAMTFLIGQYLSGNLAAKIPNAGYLLFDTVATSTFENSFSSSLGLITTLNVLSRRRARVATFLATEEKFPDGARADFMVALLGLTLAVARDAT